MQFIQTDDRGLAAAALRTRLETELSAGRKVLWLLSGGSNIAISVAVMHVLTDALTQHLTIMLIDERHGPVGHHDSNAQQLMAAGFDVKHSTFIPVLADDQDLQTTRDSYDEQLRIAFTENEVIIGQLGIGPDGHIAGILPGSPATESTELVAAYDSAMFDRITLTSHALKRLKIAYVYAFGADKADALSKLQDETIPYAEQPAQILKELPEVYIFNDSIGAQL